jgi:hypothetical protein
MKFYILIIILLASIFVIFNVTTRVRCEWHGIKHFLNSVSDVGWGEKCCDVW